MSVARRVRNLIESDYAVMAQRTMRNLLRERITKFAFVCLLLILFMGLVGPAIAPYDYSEQQRTDEGN